MASYGKGMSQREPYHHDLSLTRIRNSKWKIFKELTKPSGAGLGAVLKRWWLACRLQVLSRQGRNRSRMLRKARLTEIFDAASSAAGQRDMHGLYKQVRRLAPKKLKRKLMLKDELGHLMNPSEEAKSLRDHFTRIFHDDSAPELDIPSLS